MKPVDFKEQNVVFAENQPEYQALPALKIRGHEGQVVSCWGLSFRERLRVLFTGKVWMTLLSFNKPLTPSFLSTRRGDHFKTIKKETHD